MYTKTILFLISTLFLKTELFCTKNPPQIIEVCGGVKSIETRPNGDRGLESIIHCGTDQSKICYRYVIKDPTYISNQETPIFPGNHIEIYNNSGVLLDSGEVKLHTISNTNSNDVKHEFSFVNSKTIELPVMPTINYPGRYMATHKPEMGGPVHIYCNNSFPEEICFTIETYDSRINNSINLLTHNGTIEPYMMINIKNINGTDQFLIKSKLTQINPQNLNEIRHIFIHE
jgi:hypothetical protein